MNTLFSSFGSLDFFVQTIFISVLFAWKFPHRNLFWARFIVPSAVCCVFFWFMPYIPLFRDVNLSFILTFIFNSLIIILCFKIPVKQVVVFDLTAAAFQNISAELAIMIFYIPAIAKYGFSAWLFVCSNCIFLLLTVAFYFFFIRRSYRQNGIKVGNVKFAIMLAITVINVFVISGALTDAIDGIKGRLMAMTSVVIVDFAVLIMLYNLFEENALSQKNEVIEKILASQKDQQLISQRNIEVINRKCHDMKYQIAAIRKSDNTEERDKELREIENSIMFYDMSGKTGNDTLDIIINERILIFEQSDIKFTYMADGKKLDFMEKSDIYSLFGNAFENAIEATQKMPEGRRIISLNIVTAGNLLSVHIENSFDGQLNLRDGLPTTIKGDTDHHGFGMQSIRYIAEKYGGVMSVYAENGFFHLKIMLPLPRSTHD